MWGRNFQHSCVRKCNVTFEICLVVLRTFCKTRNGRGSRKITQWVILHFILFNMYFKVQGYSLSGRIYWDLRFFLSLCTRNTYIELFSSIRTAMYCTVNILGLIPTKSSGFYSFKLVRNISEDPHFILTGGFKFSVYLPN
jgi:hypothetical protein